MLQTIKKQIRLQQGDWLLGMGCAAVMWVVGILFMFVIRRTDPEETYVALGTMFAIIGSAGVGILIILFNLGLNFNTQISLGNRRTPFLVSYYITWMLGFFVYFGILLLASTGEELLYASIWSGVAVEELDMRGILLRFGIPASFLLPALGIFCGTLILRYKRKAFWILWVLWMLGAVGIPNLMDAADDAAQSAMGQFGLAVCKMGKFMFGRNFPALAAVITFLALLVSWLLLRRQQVEN